ncbi:MAG: glycosyltransferase family 39 protein, partial [Candidatus Acidiferrum sp.]
MVFGIGLRFFRYWLDFPIWGDEASLALNLRARDYLGLLRELDHFQVAPPLFLWMEKAILSLGGTSVLALRFMPLLAGIAGLLLFWRLARYCLAPSAAVLAAGLLAVSRWPIELAATVKPYSFDLFLAVTLIFLAIRYSRHGGTVYLACATFLIPFAVWLSYPVAFVAGSVSLALLSTIVTRGSSSSRAWFVSFNILLAAAFLGLLFVVHIGGNPTAPGELDAYMHGFWRHGFPHGGPFASLWSGIRVHFGKMFSYPVEFNGGGLIGLGLLLLGAWTFWRGGQRMLLALCLLPFALHFVAAIMHRYPYGMHPRLEQHLLPGFCLLAATGCHEAIQLLAGRIAVQFRLMNAVIIGLILVGIKGALNDMRR